MAGLLLKQIKSPAVLLNNFNLLKISSPVVPNGFLQTQLGPNVRGAKSLIKIKWKRPEFVEFNDPRKCGDQITDLGELNWEQPTLEYSKSPTLVEADENVKKVFSCDYHGRKTAVDIKMKEFLENIRRHALDEDSREVLIAKYTIRIRSLQEQLREHSRNTVKKHWLKLLIDKRNKHLRLLRMEDYSKFEWLLDEINVVFRPGPTIRNKVWRKESLRLLVDKHVDDIKTDRLITLRNTFNDKKINFYKKKAETYEWILEQEKKYGKPPSITKEEVEELWKKHDELVEKKAEKYEPPKHYHQFA